MENVYKKLNYSFAILLYKIEHLLVKQIRILVGIIKQEAMIYIQVQGY